MEKTTTMFKFVLNIDDIVGDYYLVKELQKQLKGLNLIFNIFKV